MMENWLITNFYVCVAVMLIGVHWLSCSWHTSNWKMRKTGLEAPRGSERLSRLKCLHVCVCMCACSQSNWFGYLKTSTDSVALGEILGTPSPLIPSLTFSTLLHSSVVQRKCVRNILTCYWKKKNALFRPPDSNTIEISSLIVFVISIYWWLSRC